MALARIQYEADGQTDTFSLTFPYIAKDDIVVSLDGTETSAFSWPSNSSIKLNTPPTSGVIIDIKRQTERDKILVDFQDGSTLLESDLDLAARQSFYLAQESFDQTGSTLAVANDGSYSASDRRISLLGYPTQSQDAANKQYVDDVFADGNDAAAAANESENWANYPVDSLVPEGDQEDDYSALHHATKASEDAASASSDASSAASDADAASTSASNAATSESSAATSESNAASSESAAATSESNAQASANAASDSESAASTSASNAASSASTASTEATNAADSASAAATSESNASQSASDADTSATNAQNSEDAAATSESNAANSASAAATSESNAQSSEDDASDYATEAQNWAATPEDTPVPEGDQGDDYSALHWARKAEGWAQGVNHPTATGNAGKVLRQSLDESGLEYISRPSKPNLLINGEFEVWQRGTSYSGTDDGFQGPDRWFFYMRGSDHEVNKGEPFTLGGNLSPYLEIVYNTEPSDNKGGPLQRMENPARMSSRRATVSGKVYYTQQEDIAFDVTVWTPDSGFVQFPRITGPTIASGQWTDFAVTFDFPDFSGISGINHPDAFVEFKVIRASTATLTIRLSEVKLEYGDQPTPFEPTETATLWDQCLRFFYRLQSSTGSFSHVAMFMAESPGTLDSMFHLPVRMRKTPTPDFSNGNLSTDVGSGANADVDEINFDGVQGKGPAFFGAIFKSDVDHNDGVAGQIAINRGGYIDFDAELSA